MIHDHDTFALERLRSEYIQTRDQIYASLERLERIMVEMDLLTSRRLTVTDE